MLAEGALSAGAMLDAHVTNDVFTSAGKRVPSLEYGLKAVLVDRPPEPTRLWPAAVEYLALNGGRLVNASRGFWVDWQGDQVEGGVVRARVVAHGWTQRPAGRHLRSVPISPPESRNCSQIAEPLEPSRVRDVSAAA
jgi:hypothetical protein